MKITEMFNIKLIYLVSKIHQSHLEIADRKTDNFFLNHVPNIFIASIRNKFKY